MDFEDTLLPSVKHRPVLSTIYDEFMEGSEAGASSDIMALTDMAGVADLTLLEELRESTILQTLKTRFQADQFYSYVGDILVAVNPCQPLEIYDQKHHDQYTRVLSRNSHPPHLFWTADHAYRALVEHNRSQAILISGESGAGKTEGAKYLLKHLVHLSPKTRPDILSRIVQVNPLLEAFGNACTAVNANSSRFGKFIELEYNDEGSMIGAKINDYMLQKCRVAHRSKNEMNFHIFYALFAGMPEEKLLYYYLQKPDEHRILSDEDSTSGVFGTAEEHQHFKQMFNQVMVSMLKIGLNEDQITQAFLVLASVLHITNLSYDTDDEEARLEVTDNYTMHVVAELLGVADEVELTEALISSVLHVKGERVQTFRSLRDANDVRDTLAKELYLRLFGWLVGQMNRMLSSTDASYGNKCSIGLLDMFGFENFYQNYFEQFLINASNEKLHQHFIEHVFRQETRMYELENISWQSVLDYPDNQHVIDVIFEKPYGILPILDDQSNFPDSSDLSLVRKMDSTCKDHNAYISSASTPKKATSFGIEHYCGPVVYDADGFLEKNRDTLSSDLVSVLKQSNNPFIVDLFTASKSPTGSISSFAATHPLRTELPDAWLSSIDSNRHRDNISRQTTLKIKEKIQRRVPGAVTKEKFRSKATVSSYCRRSLSELMTKISRAEPMFVRCFKPTPMLRPGVFEDEFMMRQLKCNGLLATAQLRSNGYPVQIKFANFIDRFGLITGDDESADKESVKRCTSILQRAEVENYQIGVSKVFLKLNHKDALDIHLERMKEREARRAIEYDMVDIGLPIIEEDNSSNSDTVNESSLDAIYESINPHNRKDNLSRANHRAGSSKGGVVTFNEAAQRRLDKGRTSQTFSFNESSAGGMSQILRQGTVVEKKRNYDVFQKTERETETDTSFVKRVLQVVRLFLYLFFSCILIGGAVTSKLSLLVLTSTVKRSALQINESVTLLMFCLCAPLALNWLVSVLKSMFGRKSWPSIWLIIPQLILAATQTFGVCLLVFRIFPSTDFFRATIITGALFPIPALLKFIAAVKSPANDTYTGSLRHRTFKRIMGGLVTLVAFLIQVGAIPFFITQNFLLDTSATVSVNDVTYGNGTLIQEQVSIMAEGWELPVAILFISLGWWENFVSDDWTICGKVTIPLQDWKILLHEFRDTSYVLIGLVKICLTVLFAHLLVPGHEFVMPDYDSSPFPSNASRYFSYYGLMYIQIGCGLLCTYFAGLPCKLHMQKFGFSLPLLVAPVATAILIKCQCVYAFLPVDWHINFWFCPENGWDNLYFSLGAALALWVSYTIVVSHIWLPKCERMAKIEKLFVLPYYDGVLPDFSLTVRRRRDDKDTALFEFIQGTDTVNMPTPMVYVCATMWHETVREMTQLLKSLFRLDYNNCASRIAQETLGITDPDYYDLEIHIIFDDSFETDKKTQKRVPNSFVRQFCEIVEDAARSVVKGRISLTPPIRMATPYGGRLTWTMPGATKMILHMKDKNRIRHRKRWSQVMYMYYLLGYKIIGGHDADSLLTHNPSGELGAETPPTLRYRKKQRKDKKQKLTDRMRNSSIISTLYRIIDTEKYEQAENTFILTLDGDVDFRPDAVRLLIDRMKKNTKVGAVCGRIHPIGSGPMVWYQQFEYAVGHWLQKAAEHVFGSVLCCPGCFSLFRGSALMDDNVVKEYTTKPTEATHYIQFEQGEDRWLCTLLLQQGHRIDYEAGADALTYAPETFEEFFTQRRRWSPSTLANVIDLLSSWRTTVKVNDNISTLYIFYQFILMASTILAPSTVVLMIHGSFFSILRLSHWVAYFLSILPVIFYTIICLTTKTKTQLTAAAVLSALYSVVMMIVTVGTIFNIVEEKFDSPNVIFLAGMSAVFVVAALAHPQEFSCLIYGILYFIVVPSTFILLTVFFLCNVNNVSWGTRELPKDVSEEEEEQMKQDTEEKQRKRRNQGVLGWLGLGTIVDEVKELVRGMMGKPTRANISEQQSNTSTMENGRDNQQGESRANLLRSIVVLPTEEKKQKAKDTHPPGWEADPTNPHWLYVPFAKPGGNVRMDSEETDFWKFTIDKYLLPLDEDKTHQKKIKDDLLSLRNNVVFAFMLVNFLWTVITLQLQILEPELKAFYIVGKYQPLSLMFLAIFTTVLFLQFLAMFVHRWGTFLHLMSTTHIDWFRRNISEEDFAQYAVEEVKRLQAVEPEADYDDDDTTIMTNPDENNISANGPSSPASPTTGPSPALRLIAMQRLQRMASRGNSSGAAHGTIRRNRTMRQTRRVDSTREQLRKELVKRNMSTKRGKNSRNPSDESFTMQIDDHNVSRL